MRIRNPLGAGDHAQGTTDRAGCCQTGTPRQDTDFSRPAAQHVNTSNSNILNFIFVFLHILLQLMSKKSNKQSGEVNSYIHI